MRIENIKTGMVLAQDVLDEQGNLLLEKGITLTDSYISRLSSLDLRSISIEDNIAASLKQHPVIQDELRSELRDSFAGFYHLRTQEILDSKKTQQYARQINATVDTIIAQIEPLMSDIINMQVRVPSPEEEDHAVNVCLLSVITGLYLKFPQSVLHNLAVGALLHDIGQTILPIIDGKYANSPHLHTLYGRELLLKNKYNLTIARIAAEHHENYDGTGYPLGLSGKALHPLSRLVAIANYFDVAMTEAVSTGAPYHELVEGMMAEGNARFDLNLLRAFFRSVAIYPVGCLVRLSTGQTAHVIQNRVHFPLRPLVSVNEPDGETELDLIRKPSITIEEVLQE